MPESDSEFSRAVSIGFELTIRRLGQAARSLSGQPSHVVPAVATLAIGLGAVLAIASVVDGVLLRPLPFPEPEELVFLDHAAPGIGAEDGLGFTPGMYWHVSQRSETLESVAAFETGGATLSDDGALPERIRATRATPSFAEVLGIGAGSGRWFLPQEAGEKVVVLSDGLFRRRFGGDPGVLGETVLVDGEAHEVIGVMPPELRFPEADVALWTPLRIDGTTEFGGFWLRAIGRRAGGRDDVAVERELETLLPQLGETFPERREMIDEILRGAGVRPLVLPLRDEVLGGVAELLWILLGVAVLVLLLVLANVANLTVVRAESRQRDRAVRRALGAGRLDRWIEGLAEASIVGALGILLGGVLARSLLVLLRRFGPADLPRLHEIGLDGRTAALGLGLWAAVAAILALIASGRSERRTAAELAGSRGAVGSGPVRARERELLIGVQMALALVLTVGSGLLVRTFLELQTLDPGFAVDGSIATFRVSLPSDVYRERETAARFADELGERLGALSEVDAVGAVSCLPLEGWCGGDPLRVEGRPTDPGTIPPVVALRRAGPGYFSALGIPLLEGRTLEAQDHRGGAPVVVISKTLARLYFPGQSALGQRVRPPSGDGEETAWHTVVGVVGDTPARELSAPDPLIYFPLAGSGFDNVSSRELAFVVRGGGGQTRATFASLVADLEPRAPVSQFRTTRDLAREALARRSFLTLLMVSAAAVAVLLAGVGLFGVVAYLVGRRRAELGIRLALGARRRDIRRLVLLGAARSSLLGLGAGAVLALAGARLLESQLFGVTARDPATYAAAAVFLGAVALAAAAVPARRAARLDPAESLRAE